MSFEMKRIDPVAIFSGWRYLHRTWMGPGCGLPTEGLGPRDGWAGADVVRAGFDNWDNGSTWCHNSMDYVFRGGVQFDLGGILPIFAKLVYAVLECRHEEPHDDADTFVTLSNFDWAHGILDRGLVPTAYPADFVDIIPSLAATPSDGLSGLVRINVTDQVLLWRDGRPNYGFCFLGTDESMPNHDNSKAVNQFGFFKLELLIEIFADEHPDIPGVKQRTPRPFERVDQSIIGGALPAGFAQRLQQPLPRRIEGGQN